MSTAQQSAAGFSSGSELHSPDALDVNYYLIKRWKQQGADSWGAGVRATVVYKGLTFTMLEMNTEYKLQHN